MDDFVRFICPACSKSIKAKPMQAGKRVRCPGRGCGAIIVIPAPVQSSAGAGRPVWPWVVAGAAGLVLVAGLALWLLSRDRGADPDTSLASGPPASPGAETMDTQQTTGTDAQKPGRQDVQKSAVDDPPPEDDGRPMPEKQGASSGETSLPGARGPRLETVGKLPPDVELARVYMTADPFAPAPEPLPTTFPSGTSSLDVVVSFKRTPPNGTNVGREVHGKDGPVKLKGFVLITSRNNVTGEFQMPLQCAPASGPYPDGAYQTKVLVDGEVVALLNWSIGSPPQAEAPSAQTGARPRPVWKMDRAGDGRTVLSDGILEVAFPADATVELNDPYASASIKQEGGLEGYLSVERKDAPADSQEATDPRKWLEGFVRASVEEDRKSVHRSEKGERKKYNDVRLVETGPITLGGLEGLKAITDHESALVGLQIEGGLHSVQEARHYLVGAHLYILRAGGSGAPRVRGLFGDNTGFHRSDPARAFFMSARLPR